ncbi:hypothetical protein FGD71_013115 [Streptomyces sporangiiformans]|uniref:Uncharacterized protein n=1 Tax=Streptomyces sporangiiformans TaxID=2315329 RepID=A0A505DND7_9ACTN|nr:hypothetical protein FGD71_013115 [Streptomyces sporangiiformans]
MDSVAGRRFRPRAVVGLEPARGGGGAVRNGDGGAEVHGVGRGGRRSGPGGGGRELSGLAPREGRSGRAAG